MNHPEFFLSKKSKVKREQELLLCTENQPLVLYSSYFLLQLKK